MERSRERSRQRYGTLCKEAKETMLKANSDYRKQLHKAELEMCIEYYGGKCQCECGCQESEPDFLTLGHPDNNGAEDRAKNRDLPHTLIKNNFMHTYRIQLECYNCNMSKAHNKNVCGKI